MASQKSLSFTTHADNALTERKIDRRWIEETVQNPAWSRPDPKWPGVELRFHAIPDFGGRILRVVCLETADEVRILTAFFDRNAKGPR